MYNEIRNCILKYEWLFNIIHFIYTPFRILKEYFARRKMTNELIEKHYYLEKNDKKIFYFGVPEHNNLGDMAQTYCIRKWITDNYPNYQIMEIRTRISYDKKFVKFIKNILCSDDFFLFQSGYCTRDKNPDHLMHLNIMAQFPYQKAIILPQTVKIQSKKDIQKTKRIFSHCEKLLFIARDKISYEQAKIFTKENQLDLYPDIVTSLIGRIQTNTEKKGVLLCVRNDSEKYYLDSDIKKLKEDLIPHSDIVNVTDTNSHLDVWETYKNLEKIILEKIIDFSKYKVIITDRYHGTIFSLIANTPVIVIKTNDYKVTSGVEWFEGVLNESSIKLANDLKQASEMAIEILKNTLSVENDDYFYRTFYQNSLKKRIQKV